MKKLSLAFLSLCAVGSLSADAIIFQDAFDGTVLSYDSPNDGGTPTDGSDPFSPVYFDGADASVAPNIWQFSGANLIDDMTISQNKGRARAAAIVLSGPLSGVHTVSFDVVEIGESDTLYIGVYDAFNSTGDTTNAYGYDVLENLDPVAPSINAASSAWGPVTQGDAAVTELEMFSLGGAADNAALTGTNQSFTFTAGANDLMVFLGVASANSGMRISIDNFTITAGDGGGGGDTWAGYAVDENGWVDTGLWLGLINVTHGDWVWSDSLFQYIYLPVDSVNEDGSWGYISGN